MQKMIITLNAEPQHDGNRLMARRDPIGIRLIARRVMTGRPAIP